MRVAAIYDVHGNQPALEAVLAEIERLEVDAIVVGGDAVLGPMPCETIDALRALGPRARFVRGNCDRELVEDLDGCRVPDEEGLAEAWVAGATDPRRP